MPSKYEKKAKKELESQDWMVDVKWGMNRYSRYNDYFGLFDLLAYRFGDPMRWISIKGHAGVPRAHREAVRAFFLPLSNQKEIWTYTKKGKVKKEIIK